MGIPIVILKGNVIIESGLIAKNKNGEMDVLMKTSTLGLRGTRVNADLNKKGELNVSLGEDNFGNTGIIEITNNGKKEKITSNSISMKLKYLKTINSKNLKMTG